MREIKFRAWHKDKKVYIDIYTIAFYESIIKGFIQHEYIEVDFNDIILEQYTGLKDKNDVEIYEGDIVSDKIDNYYIKWDNESADYYMETNDDFAPIYSNTFLTTDFEVIGNIHENKELLK